MYFPTSFFVRSLISNDCDTFLELRLCSFHRKRESRICIPVGPCLVATAILRTYPRFEERTMGNRCGSDIRYVSLSGTHMPCSVVCSCSHCVIERRGCDARSVQFRRIAVIGDRRRSGVRARARTNCETRKIAISWSFDWAGNRRPANPISRISGALINFAIDVSFSRFRAPLNYRLGINSPPSLPLSFSGSRIAPRIYPSFLFFLLFFFEHHITRESRIAERRGSNLMGRNVEHSDGSANRLKMYASRWLMGLNFSSPSR